jgi:peptide methionine sulfoxide reductase msrA/msrB
MRKYFADGVGDEEEAARKVCTIDLDTITESVKRLEAKIGAPAAIEVKPLENFYPAEEYHQKYLDKNPGGYCHIGAPLFARARAAEDPKRGAARS